MKFTEKDKPIKTIPKGVWESSRPDGHTAESNSSDAASSTNAPKTELLRLQKMGSNNQ